MPADATTDPELEEAERLLREAGDPIPAGPYYMVDRATTEMLAHVRLHAPRWLRELRAAREVVAAAQKVRSQHVTYTDEGTRAYGDLGAALARYDAEVRVFNPIGHGATYEAAARNCAAGIRALLSPASASQPQQEPPHAVGDVWEWIGGGYIHRHVVEEVRGDGVREPISLHFRGHPGARLAALLVRDSGWRRLPRAGGEGGA